jgi:hypothetical protein
VKLKSVSKRADFITGDCMPGMQYAEEISKGSSGKWPRS